MDVAKTYEDYTDRVMIVFQGQNIAWANVIRTNVPRTWKFDHKGVFRYYFRA